MPDEIGPVMNRIRLQQAGSEGFGKTRRLSGSEREGESFSDLVKSAVEDVDAAQKTADGKVEDVIMGRSDNMHEVMIAMEKAQLSFQLMVEIRNRAVETYQELSRMQI